MIDELAVRREKQEAWSKFWTGIAAISATLEAEAQPVLLAA